MPLTSILDSLSLAQVQNMMLESFSVQGDVLDGLHHSSINSLAKRIGKAIQEEEIAARQESPAEDKERPADLHRVVPADLTALEPDERRRQVRHAVIRTLHDLIPDGDTRAVDTKEPLSHYMDSMRMVEFFGQLGEIFPEAAGMGGLLENPLLSVEDVVNALAGMDDKRGSSKAKGWYSLKHGWHGSGPHIIYRSEHGS